MEKQWPITDSYSSPSTIPIDLSKCTRRECLAIAYMCVIHPFYVLVVFFCNMEEKPPSQVRQSPY